MARIGLPMLISIGGERSCPTVSINAAPSCQYAPVIVDDMEINGGNQLQRTSYSIPLSLP